MSPNALFFKQGFTDYVYYFADYYVIKHKILIICLDLFFYEKISSYFRKNDISFLFIDCKML